MHDQLSFDDHASSYWKGQQLCDEAQATLPIVSRGTVTGQGNFDNKMDEGNRGDEVDEDTD